MLSKRQRTEIGKRIQEIIGERPRTHIEKQAKEAGYELSPKAIYNWIAGRSLPNAEGLIALCITTKISADYILFGRKPSGRDTWDELLGKFESIAAQHGLRLQRDEPYIRSLVEKIRRLHEGQRDVLSSLVDQLLSGRAEGKIE